MISLPQFEYWEKFGKSLSFAVAFCFLRPKSFAVKVWRREWDSNPVHKPQTKSFAACYAAFLRDMVYGEAPDFKTAVATVSALADGLRLAPRK